MLHPVVLRFLLWTSPRSRSTRACVYVCVSLYLSVFVSMCLFLCVCVCVVLRCQYWLAQRQMAVEGGFQGRTNKLVDGCYTFWQGATFAVVQAYESRPGAATAPITSSGAPFSFPCLSLAVCYIVRSCPPPTCDGRVVFQPDGAAGVRAEVLPGGAGRLD